MASNAVVLVIVVGRGATNDATVDEDVNNMAKESRMAKRIVMMIRYCEMDFGRIEDCRLHGEAPRLRIQCFHV